jgi:hypothetical protein
MVKYAHDVGFEPGTNGDVSHKSIFLTHHYSFSIFYKSYYIHYRNDKKDVKKVRSGMDWQNLLDK